jgi:diguanylate cyclase (GGDEF)-like protein
MSGNYHADLQQAPEGDLVPTVPTIATASRPLQILMAEDDLVNQKVAALLFVRAGHAVIAVPNGKMALQQLERESAFDLLLLDALEQQLVEARASTRFKATHDALTGLWNRRRILEAFERDLGCSRRGHHPLGVLMADLDHFKSVNDRYGHLAGDEVLREVARRLAASVRGYDVVGRYGREELLVLMSSCDFAATLQKSQELCAMMQATPIGLPEGPLELTISVGAVSRETLPHAGPHEIIHSADEALYRTKQNGRNRAELWEPEPSVAVSRRR